MSKVLTIKLTKSGKKAGPFDIYDIYGNRLKENLSKDLLIKGYSFTVEDNVNSVTLKSVGKCKKEVIQILQDITQQEYDTTKFISTTVACLWMHGSDTSLYNSFYGVIEPYIIEYPFAYQYKDQILQNVEDYNKVFKYSQTNIHPADRNNKIEVDDEWFNKAIVYNDQQSSGILELNPKPVNNMREYMLYPKYNTDSKSILWTKSDNIYQYNTFWSIVKNLKESLFLSTCENISLDKVVNQTNMDYDPRAFRKDTLRAKDIKIRHILDDKSDIAIITQFILTPTMISHK